MSGDGQAVTDRRPPDTGLPGPAIVLINPTHRCFLPCAYCEMGVKNVPLELLGQPSRDDFARFFRGLGAIKRPGCFVSLAGGEPFLDPLLPDLVRLCREHEVPANICTNAFLVNERHARWMREERLFQLSFSLESVDPAIQNRIRGHPLAHRKVMDAIALVAEIAPDVRLTLNAIITALNLEELPRLVRWAAADPRVSGVNVSALAPTLMGEQDPRWWESAHPNNLFPRDRDAMDRCLDELVRLKIEGFPVETRVSEFERYRAYYRDPARFVADFHCPVGEELILVDPRGEVFLCQDREPVGNIRHDDIVRLWRAAETTACRRREIAGCTTPCTLLLNCSGERVTAVEYDRPAADRAGDAPGEGDAARPWVRAPLPERSGGREPSRAPCGSPGGSPSPRTQHATPVGSVPAARPAGLPALIVAGLLGLTLAGCFVPPRRAGEVPRGGVDFRRSPTAGEPRPGRHALTHDFAAYDGAEFAPPAPRRPFE